MVEVLVELYNPIAREEVKKILLASRTNRVLGTNDLKICRLPR